MSAFCTAAATTRAMIRAEADSIVLGNFGIGSPWEPRILPNFAQQSGRVVPATRNKKCKQANFQVSWLAPPKPTTSKLGHISSNDSENDLAAMVHEFIDNEAAAAVVQDGGYDSSDRESVHSSSFASFIDKVKGLFASGSPQEQKLKWSVNQILLSLSEEKNLACRRGIDCNGACTRFLLAKRLRAAGYDAGVCKSRWQSIGRLPGGKYEYIDVILGDEERFIVDLDFQSHFEIARPIPNYIATLKLLPVIFVGQSSKLMKLIQLMSNAARNSLKQNSMSLPPWRTAEYMRAKWFSVHDRLVNDEGQSSRKMSSTLLPERKGCTDQLRRIKASLVSEEKSKGATEEQVWWSLSKTRDGLRSAC